MKDRRKQPAKKDHFPYLVLAGVCIVALLASALISGVHVRAPTENVAGQAFENPTAQVEVCGKTIYLDGPGNRKELYSRTGTEAPVKISEALLADGQVYKFAVTPDGQYALYLARKTVANPQPAVNLYRVSINGGEVLRLNGPLPDNTQVNDVAISPDSQYVAYTADLGQVGGHAQFDLYTVPITGGVATRRTTVAIQNDVWPGIIFTPDSQRIVYATHNTVSGDAGLYSTPRASGSSTTLVDPEERVDREEFAVSCDSQTAYFFTDPVGSSRQLYSVPVSGGTSTPLTGTALPTLNCPAVTPTCGNTNTGTPHVFIDDRDTPGQHELYVENTATGVVNKISPPLPPNTDVSTFRVSPNGQRVAFTSDYQDSPTNAGTMYELYSVSINGGTVVKINHHLQNPANDDVEGSYQFTPDGQKIVYHAGSREHNTLELFSAQSNQAGTGIRISAADLIANNRQVARENPPFIISCDGQTVYYLSSSQIPSTPPLTLHSVSINGGVSTTLAGTTLPVLNCEAGTGTTPHIFIDDLDTANKNELYSENVATGVVTKISDTIPADEDVFSFEVTTNGQRVVYRAGKQFAEGTYTGGNWQLYSVPTTGGTAVRISGPMQPQGGVGLFRVAPDGTRVAYTADATTNTAMELYSVPILGGAVTSLSGPMRVYFDSPTNITSNVVSIFIAPNSQRVVYTADMEEWTMYEAYSVPITGGAKTRINHVLPHDHDVEGIVISPNSQRVVYRAVRTSLGKGELYSAPITGGATVRISQIWNPPASTIDVEFDANGLGAVVSCDSQTVYYLADAIGDGSRDELYSVPMTSGTITPLSGHTLPILNCAVTPPVCTAIGASCTANANCCSNVCSAGMCTTPPSNDGETDPRYAPPVDPNSGQRYLTVAAGSSGVSVTTTAGNGRYIWRYGYYLNDSQWTRFAIAPNGVAGTNWTNSTNNLNLPAGAPATGYVIIYACKKYTAGGNYTCGPRNTTQASSARYWTIAPYGATQACADECTTGATTCFGTSGVRTCGNYDADTCLDWNPTPTTCTGGLTCSNGVCGSSGACNPACQPGQTCTNGVCAVEGLICNQQPGARCNDNGRPDGSAPLNAYCVQCQFSGGGTACGIVSRCYQCPEGQVMVHDSSVSAEWRCSGSTVACTETCTAQQTCINGACVTNTCPEACATNEVCNNGVCGPPCTDECEQGEMSCTNNQNKTCGNFDTTDTCLEWSTPTTCPAGKICGNDVCVDEPTTQICNLWDRRCNNNNVEYCSDTDNNGEREWNTEMACGTQTCTSSTQTTPTSASCGTCTASQSNDFWMSGGQSQCPPTPSPVGSCWDTTNRVSLGHEAVCCNAATECAWSTRCMPQGDTITNEIGNQYLCSNKGQGPTLFACSYRRVGQTFTNNNGQSWCCTSTGNNRYAFTNNACPAP